MKLQIERDHLVKTLLFCQNTAEKRTTMPILSHGLLSANNGVLSISATDLEIYVHGEIPCQVESSGQCCVPIRSLTSIVRDVAADEIQFKLNDNQTLEISAGTAVFRLKTLPSDDFPTFETQHDKTKKLNISSHTLKKAIDHTLFSASNDETQMILNSVVFDLSDQKSFYVVSTDRHRLSYYDVLKNDKNIQNLNVLSGKKYVIPKKGVAEIRNLCDQVGQDGFIGVSIVNKTLCFSYENFVLYIRLMEGEYPNYSHFVDTLEGFSEITIDKNTFLSALKRISVVSSEKLRSVQFTFSINHLYLYSTSETLGDAKESLQPVSVKGLAQDQVVIMLNSRYLIEPLSVMESENIQLLIKNNETFTVLLPDKKQNYRSLIMPLRL